MLYEISNTIEIENGGIFLCKPDWSHSINTSRNYLKIYKPIEGEAILYNSTFNLNIVPGNLYIIPSFLPLGTRCNDKMLVHWMHLKFQDSKLMMQLSKLKRVVCLEETAFNKRLGNTFSESCELLGEQLNEPDFMKLSENIKVNLRLHSELLLTVANLLEFEDKDKHNDERITDLIKLIELDLQNPLDLNKIAKKLSLSATYVRKYFREQTGHTPREYHENQRIAHSLKSLFDSKKTISQIAFECGWEDPLYFSKVFKMKMGMSPREYRKNGIKLTI